MRRRCVQKFHSLEAICMVIGAINVDRRGRDNDLLTTLGSEETVNRIVGVGSTLHDSDGGQQRPQPAQLGFAAERSGRLSPRVYVISFTEFERCPRCRCPCMLRRGTV